MSRNVIHHIEKGQIALLDVDIPVGKEGTFDQFNTGNGAPTSTEQLAGASVQSVSGGSWTDMTGASQAISTLVSTKAILIFTGVIEHDLASKYTDFRAMVGASVLDAWRHTADIANRVGVVNYIQEITVAPGAGVAKMQFYHEDVLGTVTIRQKAFNILLPRT